MRDDDYEQLVARRKHCHACKGMINPSEVDGGRFDSGQIGPWSRWQGNLSADLMVVGQDWGDEGYFRQGEGWDRATNPTNRTLRSCCKIPHAHRFNKSRIMLIWIIAALLAVNRSSSRLWRRSLRSHAKVRSMCQP
jgi:hypothetical protein